MNAKELAENSSRLFSLPDIYLRLQRLIKEENSTADQMAELIGIDASLSARLLKIANSSFYNFPAQISTIQRSVMLIGTQELSNLVLATSVAAAFKGIPQEKIDMDSFWRHNIDCGLVARSLGGSAKYPELESLFVTGMLHNLGKLAVLTGEPDAALEAMTPAPPDYPWEREHAILGFTFADCTAELMDIWNLPAAMVDAVANQHDPASAENERQAAALLHIASRAASWMEEETKGEEGADYLALIRPEAWELAGVTLDDLETAIEEAQVEAWNLLGLVTNPVP